MFKVWKWNLDRFQVLRAILPPVLHHKQLTFFFSINYVRMRLTSKMNGRVDRSISQLYYLLIKNIHLPVNGLITVPVQLWYFVVSSNPTFFSLHLYDILWNWQSTGMSRTSGASSLPILPGWQDVSGRLSHPTESRLLGVEIHVH